MFKQEKCEKQQPTRKRGRPSGKNRVPLSLEERRARNAQYERERRNDAADAMLQLAQVAGCEPTTPNADILATVISQIRRAASRADSESLDDIKRCNDSLRAQILKLQSDLRGMPQVDLSEVQELMMSDTEDELSYQPKKKKIKREPESTWGQEYSCFRKKKVKKAPKVERNSPNYEAESDYSTPEENVIKHEHPPRNPEAVGSYPQAEGYFIINPGNSSAIKAAMTYPQPVENFVLKPESISPINTTSACFQTEKLIMEPQNTLAIDSTGAYKPRQEFLIRPDQTSSWATSPEVQVLTEPVRYAPAMEEWLGYKTESHWSPPDPFIGAPGVLAGVYQSPDSSPLLSESPLQSSESESQASSPVDLNSVLGTLTDEENMLLSGIVQQIDHSTVLGL